jgi:hypothetical protein
MKYAKSGRRIDAPQINFFFEPEHTCWPLSGNGGWWEGILKLNSGRL